MNKAMAGRAIAIVGIACGLVAIWTDTVSSSGFHTKYSNDGTVMAYLLITLIAAACLLAAGLAGQQGLGSTAAVVGAAAFGFLLFIPTELALYHLGYVGAGGWLGICAALVPIGAWITHLAERSDTPIRSKPAPLMTAALDLGLVLCVIGIWLPAVHDEGGSTSFWNLSASGHPLGILTLILVVLMALSALATAIGAMPAAADAGLLIAGVTFGFATALVIGDAFNDLGSLRAGAWLLAAGGVIQLAGAWWLRRAALEQAVETKPQPKLKPKSTAAKP